MQKGQHVLPSTRVQIPRFGCRCWRLNYPPPLPYLEDDLFPRAELGPVHLRHAGGREGLGVDVLELFAHARSAPELATMLRGVAWRGVVRRLGLAYMQQAALGIAAAQTWRKPGIPMTTVAQKRTARRGRKGMGTVRREQTQSNKKQKKSPNEKGEKAS